MNEAFMLRARIQCYGLQSQPLTLVQWLDHCPGIMPSIPSCSTFTVTAVSYVAF